MPVDCRIDGNYVILKTDINEGKYKVLEFIEERDDLRSYFKDRFKAVRFMSYGFRGYPLFNAWIPLRNDNAIFLFSGLNRNCR
ncbi:MAG: hypothetical protein ACP5L5_10430 [Vulcanisaeta sp.]|uniref:hypothetical protein n=1 Tax=Vulcanisaeta sp. TaxID=2020871 RepID=UPI003D0A4357